MKRTKPGHLLVPALAATGLLFSALVSASQRSAQRDRDVDNAIHKL
jgi:hypothetical protein